MKSLGLHFEFLCNDVPAPVWAMLPPPVVKKEEPKEEPPKKDMQDDGPKDDDMRCLVQGDKLMFNVNVPPDAPVWSPRIFSQYLHDGRISYKDEYVSGTAHPSRFRRPTLEEIKKWWPKETNEDAPATPTKSAGPKSSVNGTDKPGEEGLTQEASSTRSKYDVDEDDDEEEYESFKKGARVLCGKLPAEYVSWSPVSRRHRVIYVKGNKDRVMAERSMCRLATFAEIRKYWGGGNSFNRLEKVILDDGTPAEYFLPDDSSPNHLVYKDGDHNKVYYAKFCRVPTNSELARYWPGSDEAENIEPKKK